MEVPEERILNIKELDLNTLPPVDANDTKNGCKLVVIGKPGCLLKGTKVIMYSGELKNVEDVKEGDILMGDDNKPRNVLELCRGKSKMYCVENGNKNYVVNDQHILSFKIMKNYHKYCAGDVLDIPIEKYLAFEDRLKSCLYGYRVPIYFQDQQLYDISPYLIGFLSESHYDTIPTNYIYNNFKVRESVLAGIIDRCGIVNTDCVLMVLNRIKHCNQVVFLARSLGFKCVVKTMRYVMEVKIYGDFSNLRCLTKDLSECYNCPLMFDKLKISLYSNEEDYYGFVLDGNHRFLLEDMTVTHNTGKSTIIKSIMYSKKHIFPVGSFFSGTEDTNGFYSSIAPDSFVFNGLDLDSLEPVVKFKERQKSSIKFLEPNGINPWAIQIWDDCTSDPKFLKNKVVNDVYKNGRHWRMLHILSLQYCLDVSPSIRTATDGVFILREPLINMREKLYKNYGSIVGDFKDFCDIMDVLTEDYGAMYIKNKTTSNKLEDNIFYYKANLSAIPVDWKFGCKSYWEFHDARYNKNYTE